MDAHRVLDPDLLLEERRKRKQPVRAAEASPELRSERGLRRRWVPLPARVLALDLGAVAGEGVGEGEALLGWDVAEDVFDGLDMAAAAAGGDRGGWSAAKGATALGSGLEEIAVGGARETV